MSIIISTDSSADLGKDLYKKHKISVISFPIMLGDTEYIDGENITNDMIFDYVEKNKTLPKTAAINQIEYYDYFKSLQKTKNDCILHFSISSKISSTYNNAVSASKELENVYVVDSESLSTGVGLQVLYATVLRDRKLKFEEIIEKIENRKKYVQASFVIDKLNYLHKGGRCTSLQLLGSNVLGIKPSIMLKDGKMTIHNKYSGKIDKVAEKYVIDTFKEFPNFDNEYVFITYSSATPQTIEACRNYIKNNTSVKVIYETTAGSTVTSHCGKNTIGVLYYNNNEEM